MEVALWSTAGITPDFVAGLPALQALPLHQRALQPSLVLVTPAPLVRGSRSLVRLLPVRLVQALRLQPRFPGLPALLLPVLALPPLVFPVPVFLRLLARAFPVAES